MLRKPKVITAVKVNGSVGEMQVNSLINRLYFANQDTRIGVLNGDTRQIEGYIQVGEGTFFLAVHEASNRIYATSFREGKVTFIDGNIHQIIATLEVDEHPYGIAVHQGSGRIYVACTSGAIYAIDGYTAAILHVWHVGGAPSLLAVNERTNRIYVTNTGSDSVHILNGDTLTLIATRKVGRNPLIAPALNPVTNRIYLGNNLSTYGSELQGGSLAPSKPIRLGRRQHAVAVNPRLNRVYYASAQVSGSGKLYVVSGATRRVVKSLPAPTFASLLVNPSTHHIFVGNSEGKALAVYSGRSHARLALLPVRNRGGSLALNPRTNQVFVGSENLITVVQD
ncbi:YncE family protein [Paenibacillus oryzisoli]|uniref:YncE family protein n=1 Tax=Paenibacillus oryzisoli TaxID=1850517 RepID=UPI003D2C5D48